MKSKFINLCTSHDEDDFPFVAFNHDEDAIQFCKKNNAFDAGDYGWHKIQYHEREESQYYSVITADHWLAKNKSQEEAKNVFRAMDRKIIDSDMVEIFKQAFKDAIDKVNARNKRCKDLILEINEGDINKEDWHFNIYGVCYMSLKKAK